MIEPSTASQGEFYFGRCSASHGVLRYGGRLMGPTEGNGGGFESQPRAPDSTGYARVRERIRRMACGGTRPSPQRFVTRSRLRYSGGRWLVRKS